VTHGLTFSEPCGIMKLQCRHGVNSAWTLMTSSTADIPLICLLDIPIIFKNIFVSVYIVSIMWEIPSPGRSFAHVIALVIAINLSNTKSLCIKLMNYWQRRFLSHILLLQYFKCYTPFHFAVPGSVFLNRNKDVEELRLGLLFTFIRKKDFYQNLSINRPIKDNDPFMCERVFYSCSIRWIRCSSRELSADRVSEMWGTSIVKYLKDCESFV